MKNPPSAKAPNTILFFTFIFMSPFFLQVLVLMFYNSFLKHIPVYGCRQTEFSMKTPAAYQANKHGGCLLLLILKFLQNYEAVFFQVHKVSFSPETHYFSYARQYCFSMFQKTVHRSLQKNIRLRFYKPQNLSLNKPALRLCARASAYR